MRTAVPRLTKEERRAAIVRAVRHVFSEKGFDGTTTRELADAAGVSEALLFKHFPNKEALFEAMQTACCTEQELGRFQRISALEPSTSTLVLLVHFLATLFVEHSDSKTDDQVVQARLLLRSLTEDGAFARHLLGPVATDWVPKVDACHRAAVAAGDAVADPVPLGLRAWFAHHLPALILFHRLPANPAVDYGVSGDRLVEQVVWFTLRGMGLKDAAIRRHYNAKALALFHA